MYTQALPGCSQVSQGFAGGSPLHHSAVQGLHSKAGQPSMSGAAGGAGSNAHEARRSRAQSLSFLVMLITM